MSTLDQPRPNRGALSIDSGHNTKAYVQMLRGEILQELERLRHMASHKQHLEEIKHTNPRGKIKDYVSSHDNNVIHQLRQRRAEFDH